METDLRYFPDFGAIEFQMETKGVDFSFRWKKKYDERDIGFISRWTL